MRSLAPLIAGACLLACAPDNGSTAPDLPAASYAGAEVEHFLGEFILLPDFDIDRVFSLGLVTPISDACAGAEPVFDGRLHELNVTTPNGGFHFPSIIGRSTLVIYGRAPANPCELTPDDELVRGVGTLTILSQPNTFGYRVTGSGVTPEGVPVRVHARLQIVGFTAGSFKVTVDELRITPF
jgi:hypothetical protein